MKLYTFLLKCALYSLTCSSALFGSTVVLLDDDFTSSTITSNGFTVNDIVPSYGGVGDWQRASNGTWTIDNTTGSISNSGLDAANDRPLATIFTVSSITNTNLDQLTLEVDFSTVSATEDIDIHIRGYILGTTPTSNSSLSNMGATNGNSWNDANANTDWTIYNLNTGQLNNHSSDYSAANAAQEITDQTSTGAQSFSITYDMSGYAAAANNIANFDYIAIIIGRDGKGAGAATTINSISLSVAPEPSAFSLFALGILGLLGRRRRD